MSDPHNANPKDQTGTLKTLVGVLSLSTVGLLIATIVLASNQGSDPAPAPADAPKAGDGPAEVPTPTPPAEVPVDEPAVEKAPTGEDPADDDKDKEKDKAEPCPAGPLPLEFDFLALKADSLFYNNPDANACAGAELKFPNFPCTDIEVHPQSGANITVGYVGKHNVSDLEINTKPFWQSGMCPINVHWHLGTEHYSVGEFDENGDGPHGNLARPDWAERARALAEGEEVQDGFRCHHYDETDEKFTKPYHWKHCVGMEVGETYEVHWPHSAAGACGEVNQYQSSFPDGLFCNLDLETFQSLMKQQVNDAVGVQGQIFTIVNDESYFYPDLIRGMIVDEGLGMGQDVTYYSGSSTGPSRSNEVCSPYSPITWQVDRKCHMISASAFDKMCFDMKMQRDDMSSDLYAHGAREVVNHDLAPNNFYHGDRALADAEPCPIEPVDEKPTDPSEESQEDEILALKADSLFYNNPEANVCAGAELKFPNFPCTDIEVHPQSGANITEGYVGKHDVGDLEINTKPFWQSGMCPINVHWHLGTEHYSVGEFDENGDGPHGNLARPDWAERALAEGEEVQDGFRCHHYDETDEKFTKPYDWKYCVGMEVGETYEVHWPHSAAGACGEVNQYQSSFPDGLFCNLDLETFQSLMKQQVNDAVGVQGQIFTIVNDESYFYPDLIRGMIVDEGLGMGQDITYYSGSSTGPSRSNEVCSPYSPITWQVDRKCHMISASAFDKMCFDMKMQRDDMSSDLYAHGAREVVNHDLAPNNFYHGDRALAEAEPNEHTGPSYIDLKAKSSLISDPSVNVCADADPKLPNKPCVDLEVSPQAGSNITKGYVGDLEVGDNVPNLENHFKSSMCPVNVHWHMGTEHYSVGEFDENGNGPNGNNARPDWADRTRRLADGEVLEGFRCHHYDAEEEMFTKEYEWKHCVGMEVGETYEVHWPLSAFGACGTIDQYQSPFEDGVFCNLPRDVYDDVAGTQTVSDNVGVYGQIFTIVNDESYFYSDMIRGMVKDKDRGMGQDVTYYTGSTTGPSRSNEVCSTYSPITWQVDRKCHMISASSFDKMCYDMKMQRDDMSSDLYAHGARPVVSHEWAPDNHVHTGDRRGKYLRG